MKIPDERQSLEEILSTQSGDCEDFALLTSSFLLEKIKIDSHIIFIKFEGLKIQHAICAWKNAKGCYSYTSNKDYYETDCETIEGLLDRYFSDWELITYTDPYGKSLKVTINRGGKI